MSLKQAGAVKPIPLFIAVIVVLAVVGALGSRALFQAIAKRSDSRRAETAAAEGLLDEAERLAEGGSISGDQKFPDTPQGRMTKLIYDVIVSEQARQQALERGLEKIGWDWVMTPDSLRTRQSVQESLDRLQRAREVVRKYDADLKESWATMLRKMDAEASKSREARDFFLRFKSSSQRDGGGLYYAEKISEQLVKNHDAIEKQLRFLLRHSGAYTVDEEGSIIFEESTPDAEIERFNEWVEESNAASMEVERLEEERLRLSRERMRQAREILK